MNLNNALFRLDIAQPDEDDLIVLNLIEFGIPPEIYNRHHYLDTMDSSTFRKRFRLSKEVVLDILAQIEHNLGYPQDINNCVSPIDQLLTCLRLYSIGGHLDSIADFAGMHPSTVSKIVVKVSEAIARLLPNYISMPANVDAVRKTQQDFFNIAGFPKVIGTIDCSDFKIISPGDDDAEIYRNRKVYFSINSQFICDTNLKILNVVARWHGS